MFKRLFAKPQKIRLYKGAVVIASNAQPQLDFFRSTDYAACWQQKLSEILSLPERDKSGADDNEAHYLDLMVYDYQLGCVEEVDLGYFGFPLFWRPKVSIGVRVYRVRDGRTRYSETLRMAMPWRSYFKNLALFRHHLLDEKGIERMLYQGCLRLLQNVHDDLYR
ncbi:hypothetical protein [Methylomonas albis]|uniref:Uncharacterized protein n=1 Tax=Methylomonas albis TaxID=1854563 RepID=A0ABR9D1T1_9GAMM|nr:hypothetical protein [Methylomonas albis]MBD9357076.1 hypothetical protein [Methylomonas albis]CAD6880285.1 hypothetical protein [Methylomonas albis]